VEALAARVLPGGDSDRVVEVVRADLASAERALGLILGSPEFQQR
jgi:hypothetical protein